MKVVKAILRLLWKTAASLVLIALALCIATSVSPIYDFAEPQPFSGPDIFNPYRNFDTTTVWKRANFHTHTRVEGIFNECEKWPNEVYECYEKLNYDIVTFSNHNELTTHPFDSALQVNVYEHGYNLFKYHKLVFGSPCVNYFDHLLPLLSSQKQFQLNVLGTDSDIIQINHPLRTNFLSKRDMERLEGYELMELDSGKSTGNEYWDWALSAGHYSFALANDDLHFPDRSSAIAIRCNFLDCPSAKYSDILATLRDGCYYSMRVPNYGNGDWSVKYARNKCVPYITNIGVQDSTIYIALSQKADSIIVWGQDHRVCHMAADADSTSYTFATDDTYARFTAYLPDGEVIYTNPFARYDASVARTPFTTPQHKVNVWLSVLFNLMLLVLFVGDVWLLCKVFRKKKSTR